LAFSDDEAYLVTASPGDIARFWRSPALASMSADPQLDDGNKLWRESGDSVSSIAPGGRNLAVGDTHGHVHILHAEADDAELADAQDEINYIGHQARVVALTFSGDGALVASVGADRSLLVWDSDTGLPRPYRTIVPTSAVDAMRFSPSGEYLALSAGQRVMVVSTENGQQVAALEPGGQHPGLAFASDTELYLVTASGSLQSLAADRTGNWNLRTIWQGEVALRRVAVSGKKQHVIIVDSDNRASLFNVREGRHGATVLQLPDSVQDIVFSPGETRVLFRTARWIHRVGIYPSGLVWLDAIRAPKSLRGSKMVLDAGVGPDALADPLGGRLALLTRDTGFAEVAELQFAPVKGPILIGRYRQLLSEWQKKLGINPATE